MLKFTNKSADVETNQVIWIEAIMLKTKNNKIWGLITLLCAVSTTIWGFFMLSTESIYGSLTIPPPIFLGMVVLSGLEVFNFRLTFKNKAITYGLLEIVIVIGVLFVAPVAIVPCVLFGVFIASKFQPKTEIICVAFNAANQASQYAIAWLILYAFGGDVLSPSGWLVILAAVITSGIIERFGLITVVYIHSGDSNPLVTGQALFISVTSAIQGLMLALLIKDEPLSALLWATWATVLFTGLKAYVKENAEKNNAEERAITDSLTGLKNRLGFDNYLEEAIDKGDPIGIAFVDLDNFKAVNDTHGHHIGDKLLIEVAERLKNVVRPNDLVSRIGGDEFAIVFAIEQEHEALTSRLRSVLDTPIKIDGIVMSDGGSVGFAVHQEGETKNEFLTRSDQAMYEEKQKRHKENNIQPRVTNY